MEYKASLGTTAKIMTIALSVLFLCVIGRSMNRLIILQNNSEKVAKHTTAILLVVAVVFISYLFSTRRYLLSNRELLIKRPIGDRKIKISDIEEIRLIDSDVRTGLLRVFGNGGFLGFYGKYYSPSIGWVNLYATQRKNRIFIKLKDGKKIIITPDDISLADKLKSELLNKS